jgi:hypothetical protein
MENPGVPQPAGRFSVNQALMTPRNSSASGGYVKSMGQRYRSLADRRRAVQSAR